MQPPVDPITTVVLFLAYRDEALGDDAGADVVE
jgi:hypothetical protein